MPPCFRSREETQAERVKVSSCRADAQAISGKNMAFRIGNKGSRKPFAATMVAG